MPPDLDPAELTLTPEAALSLLINRAQDPVDKLLPDGSFFGLAGGPGVGKSTLGVGNR